MSALFIRFPVVDEGILVQGVRRYDLSEEQLADLKASYILTPATEDGVDFFEVRAHASAEPIGSLTITE
jgi:hypothetical protein